MDPLTTEQARLYRAWLEARAEALALNMLICHPWFRAAVVEPDSRRVTVRGLVNGMILALRGTTEARLAAASGPVEVDEEVWHETFTRGVGRAIARSGLGRPDGQAEGNP